ncbi:hypothetical protein SARC_07675 [Sphaeroforma arctica JP610]|uniref:Cyclic nucleotide-binding domain-containing protein n=1 Tax=Sphaeroforma arctica JP610 TaxID=667725 RepID=A0A0L0FT06_9EUKA|nr:hypothetical protein SARC_07675 [Sphaeroforma arctica JP610]KNC79947.1 hypothetical protein SARC_07675 [Sphaeroforma arctica JP610]|eukprot:XP_014153849.1 hypothetical protein SARC_07675 [Sphaeroforma arctica JP610]
MFAFKYQSQEYGYIKNEHESISAGDYYADDFKAPYNRKPTISHMELHTTQRVDRHKSQFEFRREQPTQVALATSLERPEHELQRGPSSASGVDRYQTRDLQHDGAHERFSRMDTKEREDVDFETQAPEHLPLSRPQSPRVIEAACQETTMENFLSACEIFHSQRQRYRAGDTIVPINDPGTDLYFVIQGSCYVYDRGVKIEELGELEFFGELGMFHNIPSPYQYVASVDDCQVHQVTKKVLETFRRERQFAGLLSIFQSSSEQHKLDLARRAIGKNRHCVDLNRDEKYIPRDGYRYAERQQKHSMDLALAECVERQRGFDPWESESLYELWDLQDSQRQILCSRSMRSSSLEEQIEHNTQNDRGAPRLRTVSLNSYDRKRQHRDRNSHMAKHNDRNDGLSSRSEICIQSARNGQRKSARYHARNADLPFQYNHYAIIPSASPMSEEFSKHSRDPTNYMGNTIPRHSTTDHLQSGSGSERGVPKGIGGVDRSRYNLSGPASRPLPYSRAFNEANSDNIDGSQRKSLETIIKTKIAQHRLSYADAIQAEILSIT